MPMKDDNLAMEFLVPSFAGLDSESLEVERFIWVLISNPGRFYERSGRTDD